MNKETKNKIEHLLSLLSDEQKKKDIIELNATPEHQETIDFLNKTGSLEVEYELITKRRPGYIQEKGGVTYLWYKSQDGAWVVKLWEIKRFLK